MVARKDKEGANKQVEKPKPQPLPTTFSKPQAKKAVDALFAHQAKVVKEKEGNELLPQEEYVWLVVNLKRGSTRAKVMPVRMYVQFQLQATGHRPSGSSLVSHMRYER